MGLRTRKKRRNQGKTDYRLRMGLLKSGTPRIVVRKTNKYVIVQAVESHEAKDNVLVGVTSMGLIKQGWDVKMKGSLKSVPACYLTGLLAGKKIGGEKNFILDTGLAVHKKGSRIYGVVKGLIDAGVKLKVDESVFPDEKRLSGEHLKPEVKEMVSKVKAKLGGKE